jgi:hypothetical protein
MYSRNYSTWQHGPSRCFSHTLELYELFCVFIVQRTLKEEVVDGEKYLMALMLQGYLEESPVRHRRVSVPKRNVKIRVQMFPEE